SRPPARADRQLHLRSPVAERRSERRADDFRQLGDVGGGSIPVRFTVFGTRLDGFCGCRRWKRKSVLESCRQSRGTADRFYYFRSVVQSLPANAQRPASRLRFRTESDLGRSEPGDIRPAAEKPPLQSGFLERGYRSAEKHPSR